MVSSGMANFAIRMRSGVHQMPMKNSECFDPPFTVRQSNTHLPGGNRRKIDLIIENNSILLYFSPHVLK